jgi:hypothetical protein
MTLSLLDLRCVWRHKPESVRERTPVGDLPDAAGILFMA